MLSASRIACLIEATVESMLTMTPFLRPRDGWVPTPMMSRPSGPISPTTAAILVVPMSRPTMMSDDLRGMAGTPSSWGFGGDPNFLPLRGPSQRVGASPLDTVGAALTSAPEVLKTKGNDTEAEPPRGGGKRHFSTTCCAQAPKSGLCIWSISQEKAV